MTLLFELTMPNRGSWNGRWSGESKRHLLVRRLSDTKANVEKATKLQGSHYYRWDDGWGANVSVSVIEGRTAAYWRKQSDGFYGYDWMVDSLLTHGKILASHEIPKEALCVNPTAS